MEYSNICYTILSGESSGTSDMPGDFGFCRRFRTTNNIPFICPQYCSGRTFKSVQLFNSGRLCRSNSCQCGMCQIKKTKNKQVLVVIFLKVCPHLPWELCFYWFGSFGFFWIVLWWLLYPENGLNTDETLPLHLPKVNCFVSFIYMRLLFICLTGYHS